MKKLLHLCIIVMGFSGILVGEVLARGGRGGGGFGGGGMSRGGGYSGGRVSHASPAMSRSPSISRPSMPSMSRPSPGMGAGGLPSSGARPSVGARPGVGSAGVGARPAVGAPGVGGRPSAGDLQNFLNIGPSTGALGGSVATRPGGANLGAAGGGAAAAFLQGGGVEGRPGAGQFPAGGQRVAESRIENRVGNQAGRSENRANNQAGRVDNRQQLQDNRFQRRDEVRNQVQENHPRLDFWSDHPNWAAMRITRPYRWATWGALTGWVGYSTVEPISYSYGETVYYDGETVYQGGQPVASAEEYTQQAEMIAASAPEVAPANADWLPLGVFALSPDGQASGPSPSLFLQLAISKEGVIRGALNNTATGKTQDIEGMADKKSQRCAWTVVGQARPIMETGISNLTQETAPSLVHFADGQTQQWLLVRLEEPASSK
jgi:hypothetical protein